RLLQPPQLRRVPLEQVQHVLCGADRPLDAPEWITREQLIHPVEGHEQLVGSRREAFPQCRGLRGNVVRTPGHHQLSILARQGSQTRQHGHDPGPQMLQRTTQLQLLDVFGEITRGHPHVHVLVAGQRVELLDPCFHVVAGDPLPPGDRVEIDSVAHSGVIGDDPVGNVDAEIGLCAQHRQPQLPFEYHLVLGRPQFHQFGGGIPGGEDVGNTGFLGHGTETTGTGRAPCSWARHARPQHRRGIAANSVVVRCAAHATDHEGSGVSYRATPSHPGMLGGRELIHEGVAELPAHLDAPFGALGPYRAVLPRFAAALFRHETGESRAGTPYEVAPDGCRVVSVGYRLDTALLHWEYGVNRCPPWPLVVNADPGHQSRHPGTHTTAEPPANQHNDRDDTVHSGHILATFHQANPYCNPNATVM